MYHGNGSATPPASSDFDVHKADYLCILVKTHIVARIDLLVYNIRYLQSQAGQGTANSCIGPSRFLYVFWIIPCILQPFYLVLF